MAKEGLAKLAMDEFQLTNQIAHESSCPESWATRFTACGMLEEGAIKYVMELSQPTSANTLAVLTFESSGCDHTSSW